MISFFRVPASGLRAQQLNLDVIANNLANMNTIGFKSSRVDFKDLLYNRVSLVGEFEGSNVEEAPKSVWLGAGVRTASIQKLMDQGAIYENNDQLNMAIDGEGFFPVQLPDGSVGYTRDGSFLLDEHGRMVTQNGQYLLPDMVMPPDAKIFKVTPDGIIYGEVGLEHRILPIGEVQLAKFGNPAGLLAIGGNLYQATPASGAAEVGYPQQGGFGQIVGGSVEMANVNIVNEMTNMMIAQRAYQLNARSLQTIDEMLGLANNLRR